jgi:hypothetical protein
MPAAHYRGAVFHRQTAAAARPCGSSTLDMATGRAGEDSYQCIGNTSAATAAPTAGGARCSGVVARGLSEAASPEPSLGL